MNAWDFKYVVAIADHLHFGKAALACYVSQPALGMQIRKLETSLGVKLFERINKKVKLTDIGVLVVERARLILAQVNDIYNIAKSAQDPLQGALHIRIFPTLAPYLLPHIIPVLAKIFPKIAFHW